MDIKFGTLSNPSRLSHHPSSTIFLPSSTPNNVHLQWSIYRLFQAGPIDNSGLKSKQLSEKKLTLQILFYMNTGQQRY